MSIILDARETRAKHISDLQKEYPRKSVIVLRTNIMGEEKNPPFMRFICAYFGPIIFETFIDKILTSGHVFSLDGDYCYYVVDCPGLMTKEKAVEIEESTQLGRLIDIDVYNEKAFSRQDLKCEMRRCLLCNEYAHICSRNKTHNKDELFTKIQEIVHDFLTEHLTQTTIQAIYSELELYPKFGLVSHRDSGCHTDMDYETFIHSAFTIKKYISRYIKAGLKENLDPNELQKIGLRAEKRMFEATNNINTHKGLIFLLGIFLPAFAKTIVENENQKYLKKHIKQYAQEIVGNYYENLKNKEELSHADKIFLESGIKGVRNEALEGLSLIFDIPSFEQLEEEDKYHEYLIQLMSKLNDTTIIHKNDVATLKNVHHDMSKIVSEGGYTNNKEVVNKLSDEYKQQGISPGGSADMLVIKIIYEELKHLIK